MVKTESTNLIECCVLCFQSRATPYDPLLNWPFRHYRRHSPRLPTAKLGIQVVQLLISLNRRSMINIFIPAVNDMASMFTLCRNNDTHWICPMFSSLKLGKIIIKSLTSNTGSSCFILELLVGQLWEVSNKSDNAKLLLFKDSRMRHQRDFDICMP